MLESVTPNCQLSHCLSYVKKAKHKYDMFQNASWEPPWWLTGKVLVWMSVQGAKTNNAADVRLPLP